MTMLIKGALAALALAILTALSVGGLVPTATAASKGPINTIGSPGVAIKGFDPVAYFTAGKPTKGTSEHTFDYKGATWRFASAENKALFEADPEKYVPAYGGYCAYGLAQGYLVKIEGNAWSIRDGKLYLNYDKGVQAKWEKRPASYISTADKKWTSLEPK